MAGVSDLPLVRRATTYLYSSFLSRQILIFEWNKSVLHGKAAAIDNKWATIGSFNLNSLSCYDSIKMNVQVYSPDFAETLRSDFDRVKSKCREVTNETL
ncbi:phospholipase D-like domain-containing protein [Maribacter polysaccharolyticus]|uniref:phospholipase D-like domain-containing protein n=1 Tax=Maribacter polysaccharolyticus TaxID=3020831 RepID=UPI003B834E20